MYLQQNGGTWLVRDELELHHWYWLMQTGDRVSADLMYAVPRGRREWLQN